MLISIFIVCKMQPICYYYDMTLIVDSPEVGQIAKKIEETARQDLLKTSEYIDLDNNFANIEVKRHTIVFGRRGAGKTTILKELNKKSAKDASVLWIDADIYKDLTFPDTVIEIFRETIEKIILTMKRASFFWFMGGSVRTIKELRKFRNEFGELKSKFEKSEVTVVDERSSVSSSAIKGGVSHGASLEGAIRLDDQKKIARTSVGREQKIELINRRFADFRARLLTGISQTKKHIYLVLDDFYHLRVEDQAPVLDYLARLLKNTKCYLKISTISHRSVLYRAGNSIKGLQLGHDANDINLDRSFRNFEAVNAFMRQLWTSLCKSQQVNDDIFSIFAGDSWRQIVLASGGVPRDFMNIFVKSVAVAKRRNAIRINVNIVNEAANLYFRETKRSDLYSDSEDEMQYLEKVLRHITEFCISEKKKNVFLISVEDIEKNTSLDEALMQLCDFRSIHEVHENTSSAFRPGKRFKAYLLDVGLYAYPQRRGDNRVEEVRFWEKDERHRIDELRNAPVYQPLPHYDLVHGDVYGLIEEYESQSDESVASTDRAPDRKSDGSQTKLDL